MSRIRGGAGNGRGVPGCNTGTGAASRTGTHLPEPQWKGCTGTAQRPIEEKTGAPGWNRTSDTRFRKHAASVTGRCRSDAIVLHSTRTAVCPVLPSAFRWSAVMSRLVGILSAIRSELADAGGRLPNAREDPTRPLAPRTERNRCHTCVAVLFSRQPAHGIQPETLRIRHTRKGRPAPPGAALS